MPGMVGGGGPQLSTTYSGNGITTSTPTPGGAGGADSFWRDMILKQQRWADYLKKQQMMKDQRNLRGPVGFGSRHDELGDARKNYEMEKMAADLRGPSKVLVPTGYGHMLQEDVSSMPFSMRPQSTQLAAETPSQVREASPGMSYDEVMARSNVSDLGERGFAGSRAATNQGAGNPAGGGAQADPSYLLGLLRSMMGGPQQQSGAAREQNPALDQSTLAELIRSGRTAPL